MGLRLRADESSGCSSFVSFVVSRLEDPVPDGHHLI